ncbi:MAG TPA: hypothetical protein PLA68_07780 [Panacibacter sp.]|nr:hypothetical protein [Panacibacter sp.]
MAANLFFKHLNDYPSDRETGWSEELQGVSHNDDHWFITQKNRLWKIPVSVDLNSDMDGDDPARGIFTAPIPPVLANDYNHLGDLDYNNGYLFIGLENTNEEYTSRILCLDANTLEFIGSALLNEQGTHASWCAVNPADGFLYSSWSDNATALFVYTFSVLNNNFTLLFDHMVPLINDDGEPYQLSGIQGGVFSVADNINTLYISSNAGDTRGVQIFDWPDAKRIQEIFIDFDFFTIGEEIEGITYWDLPGNTAPRIKGQLHVLELDNDIDSDDIKCFKHYSIIRSEFVANNNPSCREVHHWDCSWLDLIKREHKVPYNTAEEAFADNYDACHYCIGGEHDKR